MVPGRWSAKEILDEGNPEDCMQLNQPQKAIIPLARKAYGKVMLITGCSVSGRTHMMLQVAKLYFKSVKRYVIQVMSITNHDANDLPRS